MAPGHWGSTAALWGLTTPSQEGSQLCRQSARQLLTQYSIDVPGSHLAVVDTLANKAKKEEL